MSAGLSPRWNAMDSSPWTCSSTVGPAHKKAVSRIKERLYVIQNYYSESQRSRDAMTVVYTTSMASP